MRVEGRNEEIAVQVWGEPGGGDAGLRAAHVRAEPGKTQTRSAERGREHDGTLGLSLARSLEVWGERGRRNARSQVACVRAEPGKKQREKWHVHGRSLNR